MSMVRPVLATALVAGALAAIRFVCPPQPSDAHGVLRQVYTPHFARVPTVLPAGEAIREARDLLRTPAGSTFVRRWVPSQSGTLWIFLLVTLVVGFDFDSLKHPRHVDLALMLLLGAAFFDIIALVRHLQSPFWLRILWWMFDLIVAVTSLVGVRAIWRVYHPFDRPWRPNLCRRALATLAVLMVMLDLSAAVAREPDDAGYFANLGAQRLRERMLLPYGDPLLTGSPGAAYGPLLYVAHIPFQWLVDPIHLNPISSPSPPLGSDSQYRLPSPLATQLCAIAFLLFGAWALFAAGARFGSRELGWALVALFCGSAFVVGMGGDEYFIGGVTYVSHLAAPALTTAAFVALGAPFAAGVLLVAAAGVGFYPAFLAPAWLGYYWYQRRAAGRFVLGMSVSATVVIIFVLLCSRPAGGRGLIGTILWDTLGHHTDPAGYGSSPFSFWGQRSGWQGWMIHPLLGTSGLTAPAMLLFVAFAASAFFITRGRGAQALALVSAAVVIGATLVKIHPTGGYVAWFYPFLLLGLFLPSRRPERPESPAGAARPASQS